ncbi:MAG: hypothetical protein J5684_02550 [Eubacterium sp.]|nr:hypothetical protein [Eubacterium sp.]
MNKKVKVFITLLLTFVLLTGCNMGQNPKQTPTEQVSGADSGLTVKSKNWYSTGSGKESSVTFSEPKSGDEVYNGFDSVIKVKSVGSDKIVLSIDGCLVEPNEDGGINLNKDPLKKVTLNKGQSIELSSQTMDVGVDLTINYN